MHCKRSPLECQEGLNVYREVMARDKQSKPVEYLRQASEALGRTSDTARKRLSESADSAIESASRMAERASDASSTFLDSTTSAIRLLRSTPARALDGLFRKASVPVYLLPTSSNPADFKLVFDFGEMMQELRSGILVRPVIMVWAGRRDFDEDYFADHLKDEFVRQFDIARDNERDAHEADIENLASRRQDAKREMAGPLGWMGGIGLGAVAFDPSGIMALIYLGLFISKGKRAVTPLIDYMSLGKQVGRRSKEMERRLQDFDKQFDRKNKVFQRAVRNLDVAVHPHLQTLVELMCEVDSVPFTPGRLEEVPNDYPDVQKYLQTAGYIEAVNEDYRSLLGVI